MTKLMIHYESPPNDPLKVPRPHTVENRLGGRAQGGEVGRCSFIGVHPLLRDPNNGVITGDKIDVDNLHQYIGWFAAFDFATNGGFAPFTVEWPILRIDVLDQLTDAAAEPHEFHAPRSGIYCSVCGQTYDHTIHVDDPVDTGIPDPPPRVSASRMRDDAIDLLGRLAHLVEMASDALDGDNNDDEHDALVEIKERLEELL